MIISTNLVFVPYSNEDVWASNRYPTGKVFDWFAGFSKKLGEMGGWSFIDGRAVAHKEEPVLGIIAVNDRTLAEQFCVDFAVNSVDVRPYFEAFAAHQSRV